MFPQKALSERGIQAQNHYRRDTILAAEVPRSERLHTYVLVACSDFEAAFLTRWKSLFLQVGRYIPDQSMLQSDTWQGTDYSILLCMSLRPMLSSNNKQCLVCRRSPTRRRSR